MHELVQQFLNKKEEELQAKKERKKAALLNELGLYEKEYSSESTYSQEYPFSEYDSETQTNKWYKRNPIQISDDVYEEIKKYSNIETDNKPNNPIATTLKAIAVITYIVGFIMGISMGNAVAEYSWEFSWATAFVYWCITFISGTMLLGFAEIISLLDDIKRK